MASVGSETYTYMSMKPSQDTAGFETLEELKDQITEYYETYYAELRSQVVQLDIPVRANVPEHLKGYRRVIVLLGQDGIVIVHWPAERDSFDFHISPDRLARDLAAEQCGGEQILDYEPGSDFGTYEISEPLKLVVDSRVVWVAQWTRLEISSRLDVWQNKSVARKAAREQLRPYTGVNF